MMHARIADEHPDAAIVLVVDDDQSACAAIQMALEAHGYRAIAARNGAIAAALYTQLQDQVGVVLTDLMMPIMDGLTLIRVLKKLNPEVKVIASSSAGSEWDRAELRTLGVGTFLPKPYATETLVTALRDVMGRG